jgi:hypothetical protein
MIAYRRMRNEFCKNKKQQNFYKVGVGGATMRCKFCIKIGKHIHLFYFLNINGMYIFLHYANLHNNETLQRAKFHCYIALCNQQVFKIVRQEKYVDIKKNIFERS